MTSVICYGVKIQIQGNISTEVVIVKMQDAKKIFDTFRYKIRTTEFL